MLFPDLNGIFLSTQLNPLPAIVKISSDGILFSTNMKSIPASVPAPLTVGKPPLIEIASYSYLNHDLVESWAVTDQDTILSESFYQPALAAILICKMWGLRISEVLRISSADFSPYGIVFIRSSKKSRNRVIYIPFEPQVLKQIRNADPHFLIFPVPESQCIRIAKALHSTFSHAVGARIQRTHAGRYEFARWLMSITTQDDVQYIMGHLDSKNTQCYLF